MSECTMSPDDTPARMSWLNRHVVRIAAALCFTYLVLELILAMHMRFHIDEFQFAYFIHRLRNEMPYRDFNPHKTLLGLYLQMIPMLFADDLWLRLLLVRAEMVFVNTVFLLFGTLYLSKRWRADAALVGLALLVASVTFLQESPVIRSDTLCGFLGVTVLLLLLAGRFGPAGLVCGLTFLVAQKGAYHVLANTAAVGVWVLVHRNRESLKQAARFCATAAGSVAVYFAIWTAVAGWDAVFGQAVVKKMRSFSVYFSYRHFWFDEMWARNPFFCAAAVGCLLLLWFRPSPCQGLRDRLLATYGTVLLGLGLWHKAPHPNFFPYLMPAFAVIIVAGVHSLLERDAPWSRWLLRIGAVGFVVFGLYWPLSRLPRVFRQTNTRQGLLIRTADRWLGPDETYIAGVNILYNREQAHPRFDRIDDVNAAKWKHFTNQEVTDILMAVDAKPVKLLLMPDGVHLPQRTRPYFDYNYMPVPGGLPELRVYAPTITPGDRSIRIRFDGRYVRVADGDFHFCIDGQTVKQGETIHLERGAHTVHAEANVRLRLRMNDNSY